MMSSLANAILFFSLVLTSVCVLIMYRKLKQLDAYNAEYKRTLDRTAAVLDSASQAVRTFGTEGREVLVALGVRIDEAKAIMSELETVQREKKDNS